MAMQLEITKKVRMTLPEAKTLAKLARKRQESESQVLRQALDLLARRQQREEAIDGLIKMTEGQTYTKSRFRLK